MVYRILIIMLGIQTEVGAKKAGFYCTAKMVFAGLFRSLPKGEMNYAGYRDCGEPDVEGSLAIAGARNLDFSIDYKQEILVLRVPRKAPCRKVLHLLLENADEIDRRISELRRTVADLVSYTDLGFPTPLMTWMVRTAFATSLANTLLRS